MKNLFSLYALFYFGCVSAFAQFNYLGSCGSNAEFAVEYMGNDIFVSTHFDQLEFYDITNPYLPLLVSTVNLPPSYPILALYHRGDLIYTHGYQTPSQFAIIDATNMGSPYVKGSCAYGTYTGNDLNTLGNYAYIKSTDSIYVYDCTNQTAPTFLAAYSPNGTMSGKLVIKNSYLLVGSNSGAKIFTINGNGTLTFLTTIIPVSGALATNETGTLLFEVNGAGVKVYDFSNALSPAFLYQIFVQGVTKLRSKENFLLTLGNTMDAYRLGSLSYEHVATLQNTFGIGYGGIDSKDTSIVITCAQDSVMTFDFNHNNIVSITSIKNPGSCYTFEAQYGALILTSKEDNLEVEINSILGQCLKKATLRRNEQLFFYGEDQVVFSRVYSNQQQKSFTKKILLR